MVLVVFAAMVMAALAIPALNRAMTNERINAAVNQFSGAISSARFHAIQDSQTYTLVLTAPANTYVVTNTGASPPTVGPTVPLPSYVSISGGTGSPYTYTLCPNGLVYGTGGCSLNPNQPPALSFTYQGRQINVAISDVGNVTTTTIQ